MRPLRCLFVIGTRPEAIKMAPVVRRCLESNNMEAIVCLTGQHREMLIQSLEYFEIDWRVNLNVMTQNQTLSRLTASCVEGIDGIITQVQPDYVLGQGDTTTAMAAALAAFYRRIPFVHIEAGLRTGNLLAPFPEEVNRRIADLLASLHCAPTVRAAKLLIGEGIPAETIYVTGNTVVDALLFTVAKERANAQFWEEKYAALNGRPMILITAHRRESFGEPLLRICEAIRQLAGLLPQHVFVFPVHLNPNVRQTVFRSLSGIQNVFLIDPVPYPEFVWLMDRCALILTDSGGIQEEAPALQKPVVILRDITERPEILELGIARLAGTCTSNIVEACLDFASHIDEIRTRPIRNPFGDGKAAERIIELVKERPTMLSLTRLPANVLSAPSCCDISLP